MATLHNSVAAADLHEPKGVASATIGQAYISDGAGSGAWTNRTYTLNVQIPDLSTAQSVFVPVPVAGTITKIQTAIQNAITGADATVTAEIGGVAVTNSSITVTQSGSAAGDVDSSSPSAANTVAVGDAIEIITDGGSSTACVTQVTILIQRSA